MSTFTTPIKRIRAIERHPNAEAIEFAVIDGYRSIVKKGQFQVGELVAYIAEGSVLPQWLLKHLSLWDEEKQIGKLAGTRGDRLKAVRLRGELSQGICLSAADGVLVLSDGQPASVSEGDNVCALLGITKYEPPIPVSMAGEVFNAGQDLTIAFDVENWKSFPDIIREGEEVVFTEKLHGTCTIVAVLPYKDAHPEAFGTRKNILVFSKGLGARGLVFKNNEKNQDNLYVRSTRDLVARIDAIQTIDAQGPAVPLFILGETIGPGVQDLAYGNAVGLRVFAAARGYRGDQVYFDWPVVVDHMSGVFGFETVPELYRGPFSEADMRSFTDGKTTMGAGHIREGIVVVPLAERRDPRIGRVCLKSVSSDYLTRKGGTEFS